jgi:hypothetical protein
MNPIKIGLIAFDNFTDLDLFLHWDLLNRVRLYKLHSDWEAKILGTAAQHHSVSGLVIPTSGPIEYAVQTPLQTYWRGPQANACWAGAATRKAPIIPITSTVSPMAGVGTSAQAIANLRRGVLHCRGSRSETKFIVEHGVEDEVS